MQPRFIFSKCPKCEKENRSAWVDLTAQQPGAKVFRTVKSPVDAETEGRSFVVVCRHCHARYKVTPASKADATKGGLDGRA